MDRFKHVCWLHTQFMIARYLMSNAEGREDGAEKALRHRELCKFYVAAVRGTEVDEHSDSLITDYENVHANTQKLTDYMDTEIGFPITGRPDYTLLEKLFFNKFHILALEALNT